MYDNIPVATNWTWLSKHDAESEVNADSDPSSPFFEIPSIVNNR